MARGCALTTTRRAQQGGAQMGGPTTKQYYIPEPWKLQGKGAKIVAKHPFKRDGHVQLPSSHDTETESKGDGK